MSMTLIHSSFMVLSYNVRSSLYLVIITPSIVVSIFDLYHFLSGRALRSALNNHAIILLLSCRFFETITDIIWQIYYYRNGVVLSSTHTTISWVTLWGSIGHYIMPAFIIIVVFSVILLVRVFYYRHRARRRIEWRNYKKLTAQLLPISVLYIALQLPPMILYAAYSASVPYSIGINYYGDGLYFTYWIILLTSLASVVSLPDSKSKCRNLFFFWRKRHAIGSETLTMIRSKIGRTPAAALTARY